MIKFIFSVILLISIGYVATDIYLPSLPDITRSLHTSKLLAQLTITLYLITFSLAQLFYGPLSDKIGRRKVFLFGLTFSLIGTALCFSSFSILQLIIGRFLQGLGLSAGAAVARPIIRDVATGDAFARLGSILAMSASLFMAAGPAAGGYLQDAFGWRSPFITLALFTVFVLVITIFWLPETNKHLNSEALKPKFYFKIYAHLLTNPIFMGYTLCAASVFAGLIAYFTTTPFLLQNVMGLSPIAYGWSVLIVAAGLACGGICNTFLLKWKGRHHALLYGVLLIVVITTFMLIFPLIDLENPYVVVGPMFFYTFGFSIVMANATAGAFSPFPRIAGFAGALFGCLTLLGGAFSSFIMAIFQHQNQMLLALFLLAASIGAALLQWLSFSCLDKKS